LVGLYQVITSEMGRAKTKQSKPTGMFIVGRNPVYIFKWQNGEWQEASVSRENGGRDKKSGKKLADQRCLEVIGGRNLLQTGSKDPIAGRTRGGAFLNRMKERAII